MATGLYSPVTFAQHASSPRNIANIVKQGFIPSGINSPGFQVADLFQPGKKVFTSTSPSLLSQYGDDVVDVISSARNLRLPSGGIDFTKGTIGFGDEIASTVGQANKGMRLAAKLRAGAYANSPLARRLLETGTTVNPNLGINSLVSRLGKRALPYLRTAGKLFNRAPIATAISDALFGTTYTADTARDINKLLGGGKGQQEIDAAKKAAATKAEVSKKEAIKGGAAGASTPRQKRQRGTQKQEQQRQQRSRSRAAQRGQPSRRQQRSRSRAAQRRSPRPSRPNLRNRAQGGIVSINDMIGSL